MDCTLATLIACFRLSGLYIDSGLSWQDAGVYSEFQRYSTERIVTNGVVETGATLQRWQDHSAVNPYGRLAIGYEVSFPRMTWRIEASHISSLAINTDRGVNAISIGARWYPFGGRR